MKAERYERGFLLLSGGVLVVFLGALAYATVARGITLPTRVAEVNPNTVRKTPPFDQPGVRDLGGGRYEVVLIGQTWAYTPAEIDLPVGAQVTFKATSVDVIHGLKIEGTLVNVMLIPGQVTEVGYTFDKPGVYPMICHEYCGVLHHTMHGKVVVR